MDLLTPLLVALAAGALPALYLYAASAAATRFPPLRNKRICLLIAHPDDEAMFFGPTVVALTRRETGNQVKILCLSSGNATGLGPTRKLELLHSGALLGLRDPSDVFVVDQPARFPDSMAATWDASAIAGLLASAFAPPVPTIDVLVTFDGRGVSGHPNHISLYHGARRFVASLPPLLPPPAETSPVELYVLRSVGVARKYAGAADALVTTLLRWGAAGVEELVFVSGWAAVRTGWRAMTQAHRSQMVWFRWGWIALSRYMYVNDLRLDVVAPERGPGWAREEGKEAM